MFGIMICIYTFGIKHQPKVNVPYIDPMAYMVMAEWVFIGEFQGYQSISPKKWTHELPQSFIHTIQVYLPTCPIEIKEV